VKTKSKKIGAPTNWKDEFYVQAFQFARLGMSEEGIASALGVQHQTFRKWKKKRPALQFALTEGRKKDTKGSETFADYVYERLPDNLKKVWDELQECGAQEENAIARLENMLSECGKRGRQQLFVHSLIHNNFNLSKALKAVNLSRKQFDYWLINDPGFAELIDEMEWHKKNFLEGALLDLVRQGDPGVVKFVNQTYNADRGYGKVTKVDKTVTYQGTIRHAPVDLEELDLDLESKKKLRDQLRKQREGN
jgi:hypothetical protein